LGSRCVVLVGITLGLAVHARAGTLHRLVTSLPMEQRSRGDSCPLWEWSAMRLRFIFLHHMPLTPIGRSGTFHLSSITRPSLLSAGPGTWPGLHLASSQNPRSNQLGHFIFLQSRPSLLSAEPGTWPNFDIYSGWATVGCRYTYRVTVNLLGGGRVR